MLRSITIIAILVTAIIASYNLDRPSQVKPKESSNFSAERVITTLEDWGDEPHPIGSLQLEKVRDKIVSELTDLGLNVQIENGYTSTNWSTSYKRMAQVENIVAMLPGEGTSDKTIVLCGHYDSVVEGPGAGDDGYAIASMIETVRLLKEQNRKHHLLLLITDGEEYGLLGAKYHMENNGPHDYAVLLNYEARGNEGPGIAFEWSEDNHWLVSQVAEAYQKPVANSMSFEVYKLMPNSSDFTVFQKYGIKGVNHAFIDGFSYYHHPQDDVHHLSPESVQHTGENMYLAARHFINADLDVEHNGNATFFNFYGWFVYYSSIYDLFLLILGLLLSIIYIVSSSKKGLMKTSSLLASFFTLVLITIACLAIVFGLSTVIKNMYPHYATFYAYQYYNHEWYLLSGIGFILIAGAQGGSFIAKKWGIESLRFSVLLLLSVFSIGLFLFLKTGAYLMIIPLISASTAYLIISNKTSPLVSNICGVVTLLIIAGIWVFLSHTLYLAFSITILAAAVLPSLLFVYILVGLFYTDEFSMKLSISILGIGLFVVTMIMAHVQSKPSKQKPLLIDLEVYHHTDTNRSYLASFDDRLYHAHPEGMRKTTKQEDQDYISADIYVQDLKDVDFRSLHSQIDTLYDATGLLYYKLTNPKRAESAKITLNEMSNIDSLFINGELNNAFEASTKGSYVTHLFGVAQDTAVIRVVKRDNSKPVNLVLQNIYSDFIQEVQIPENALWAHPTTRIIYSLDY